MQTTIFNWRVPTDTESNKALAVRELASDVENTTSSINTRLTSVETIAGTTPSDATTTAQDPSDGSTVKTLRVVLSNIWSAIASKCASNDTRLSNARTPTLHAASHAANGSDPLTLSKSQVGLDQVDNTSDAAKQTSNDARYGQLDAINLWNKAQGLRGSVAANAAGLYVPWLSGDTLPAIQAGTAAGNQHGLQGTSSTASGVRGLSTSSSGVYGSSGTSFGVRGTSTSSTGCVGTSSSGYGVVGETTTGNAGVEGVVNDTGTTNTPYGLEMRHLTTGVAGTNFGIGLNTFLHNSVGGQRQSGTMVFAWDDATDLTRTSRLGLSIVVAGVTKEALRLTQNGLFIPNLTADPTGTPSGGGWLYTLNGALKFKGSGGTPTVIANA